MNGVTLLTPGCHPLALALMWFPANMLHSSGSSIYIQFIEMRGAISPGESLGLLLLSGANYGLFQVV